jgi:hypothetical protein
VEEEPERRSEVTPDALRHRLSAIRGAFVTTMQAAGKGDRLNAYEDALEMLDELDAELHREWVDAVRREAAQ